MIREQIYTVISIDVQHGVKGRVISSTSKLVACYPLIKPWIPKKLWVWGFSIPLSRNCNDTVRFQKIHLGERKEW